MIKPAVFDAIRAAVPRLPRGYRLVEGRLEEGEREAAIWIEVHDFTRKHPADWRGFAVPARTIACVEGGCYLVGWLDGDEWPSIAGVVPKPEAP